MCFAVASGYEGSQKAPMFEKYVLLCKYTKHVFYRRNIVLHTYHIGVSKHKYAFLDNTKKDFKTQTHTLFTDSNIEFTVLK